MGANLCELVRLFVLSRVKDMFGAENVGLYYDDGMAVFPNCSGFKVDKSKKQAHVYFKSLGLRITVESPLMITHFLNECQYKMLIYFTSTKIKVIQKT